MRVMEDCDKDIEGGVSIEKIAYYVKRLYQVDKDSSHIILAIKSQFCDRDITRFSSKYNSCLNDDGVRYIANLLCSRLRI